MLNSLSLSGFWLNLDCCHERKDYMVKQFSSFGLCSLYTRVSGVLGDPDQAQGLGLKPGEWGAWLGWMSLLRCAAKSSSSMVHLLEDDTEITDHFKSLLCWSHFPNLISPNQFVCTDAYITPSQAIQIADQALNAQDANTWLVVSDGPRIPCLNSILLTPACAQYLHDQLQSLIEHRNTLYPVDVAIASLSVKWVTIAPFVTGPILDLSADSSTRLDSENDLALSRFALTLLRRSLLATCDFHDLRRGLFELMLKLLHSSNLRSF